MNHTSFKSATIIGSGPNGLAAAVELARAGLKVRVLEAASVIGGGTRTEEATLPGFLHDICSTVHPLGAGSPYFSRLPLHEHGLEWVQPATALAHPFDDGTAAVLDRSIRITSESLGKDSLAYRTFMEPMVRDWEHIAPEILGPIGVPRRPFKLARFGLQALRTAKGLAEGVFDGERARALFGGIAAHAMRPLDAVATASFGLVLAAAGHAAGWPFARGGSRSIGDALASYLTSLGGEIVTDNRVESIDGLLRPGHAVVCDLTTRGLLQVAGDRLPESYRSGLEKFRYGGGVFKIDWALNHPIPWKAEGCERAGTVHLAGPLAEIVRSEAAPEKGEHPERPYVIVTQPSLFDPSRAPEGQHIGWAYCHVPHGSDFDMTERIEDQIERFAPGFRDCIVARKTWSPAEIERHNPNMVGGSIGGGSNGIRQLFLRPTWRRYSTPVEGLYICSSSTPPGGGVHGMCGFHAARRVLDGR